MALYPGCDVVLQLDGGLRLRNAPAHHVATFYALVLEHCRHAPRSVHIMGATTELRDATARVVEAAFPAVDVTEGSTVAKRKAAKPTGDATTVPRVGVALREEQHDMDARVDVHLTRDSSGHVVARQAGGALFPGCDIKIHVDLKLRYASLLDVSTAYALALAHTRHDPRSIQVDGNGEQRSVLASLLATVHTTCDVSRRAGRSGYTAVACPVPRAHYVNIGD